MKKGMIGLLLALVVVLGGAAVYFLVFAGDKEEPPPAVSTYIPGEYFVTNVKNSIKLLKTTIVLETSEAAENTEFQAFLSANNHIIRNTIVFILREKDDQFLQASDVQDKLKVEITDALNENLGIDSINTIYFSDYAVQ